MKIYDVMFADLKKRRKKDNALYPRKAFLMLRDGSYDYVSFRIETNPKGQRAAALHT